MDLSGSVTDARAKAVGEGLLDHSWPVADWRHAEHCIATYYLVRERADLDLARQMPDIIRSYNLAHGGENTETAGYHHTMTLFYLSEIQTFASGVGDLGLGVACDRLLRSDIGDKAYVFRYWTRDRLFSTAARLGFMGPDLAPIVWSPEVQAVLPPSTP